jgi:hypothetical protein
MSQIVAGFVDLAVPSLERVLVVLERARDAPKEVRAGLAASFERAERDVMPGLMASLDQAEMFLQDVERESGPAARTAQRGVQPAPKGGKRGADPRPVTRGSGGGKTRRTGAPLKGKGVSRG